MFAVDKQSDFQKPFTVNPDFHVGGHPEVWFSIF